MPDLSQLTKYQPGETNVGSSDVTVKYNGKVLRFSKELSRLLKNDAYVEVYFNEVDTIALKVVSQPGISIETRLVGGNKSDKFAIVPIICDAQQGTYVLTEQDAETKTYLFKL